jgi:hypothetical protein
LDFSWALQLFAAETVERVHGAGDETRSGFGKRNSTARKPPEKDCGNQPGERFQPLTLPTPDWKLKVHTRSPGRFPPAGRWRNKAGQRLTVISSR